LYYLAPGDARRRGYKRRARARERERKRERERERDCSLAHPPRDPSCRKALDLPFIDARRGSRCTMGGVAMR
jgi:hypothetical protein